jgi:hypothetical protein
MKYLAPPPRPETPAVAIPGLAEAETLSEKAEAIVAAVANADISPDVGERLIGAISNYTRIRETDELERRIRELEVPHEP